MQAQYFNKLVEASEAILKEQAEIELKKGMLKGDDSQKTSQEVNITIGLFGTLYGWVTFGMSRETAKCVSSATVKAFLRNERIISNTMIALVRAVIEKVLAQLREEGMDCYCTDPTLILGSGAKFICPVEEKLSLTLQTFYGEIEIKAFFYEIPSMLFDEKIIELPDVNVIGDILSV